MADPNAFPNLDLEKINADIKKSVEKIKKNLNIDQIKADVQADVAKVKEDLTKHIEGKADDWYTWCFNICVRNMSRGLGL